MTSNALLPPPSICVLDSSLLIDLKKLPAAHQWPLLLRMSEFVRSGHLAFPKHVATELEKARHPDAPGVWVVSAKQDLRYPPPSDEALVEVLGVASQLIEVDAEGDIADPYVVALAYDLRERYPDTRVLVATEDKVDRLPRKIALTTACERLELEHVQMPGFLDWVNEQLQDRA